jgi:DNA-binding GntR family transcriptional regulator
MALGSRSGTAQEQAYAYVRERILSGRYPGGMRLDLDRVAAAIGTSRLPVREALRQLDGEGLVTIRPNRGAVVTQLTAGDLVEVFEMRAVLEGLAARVAVGRLDADDLDDLARLAGRMERSRGDGRAWLRHHDAFHDLICCKSGRPRLVEQTALLRRSVEPYLRVHVGAYDPPELAGSEHAALVEVLRGADPDRAERALRDHVGLGATYVLDILKGSGSPTPPGPTVTGGRGAPGDAGSLDEPDW